MDDVFGYENFRSEIVWKRTTSHSDAKAYGSRHDVIFFYAFPNAKKNDVCGIKIFMGSSTGNLLVDNPLVLDKIFADSELLIATHCEDEQIIKSNFEK